MVVALELPHPEVLLERIDSLSSQELDALPHGAIQLDCQGRVLQFNACEADDSHLNRADVLGRDFFNEVAPCARGPEFQGRFLDGVARKSLHVRFRFQLSVDRKPRHVAVTLYYSARTESVWIFLWPLEGVLPEPAVGAVAVA